MKRKIFALLVATLFVFSGCSADKSDDGKETTTAADTQDSSAESVSFAEDVSDMMSDRDYEVSYDEEKSAVITLNGSSASCSSDAVEISGSTVTIKDEGTYVFTGTLDDGMIIVNADEKDKPQIVLDSVSVTSSTSAALYIYEADKVFVTLQGENTLSNGGSFTAIDDSNIDAAVFSKQDLTFNGSGTLNVSSPAGHGIVCKDDLVFTSGSYNITCASHGVDANDSIRLSSASITVDAGKDGLHAENNDDSSLGFIYVSSGSLSITAQGDGISAGNYVQIEDGSFDIVSGGGSENGTKESSDSYGDMPGGMPGMPGGSGGGKNHGDKGGRATATATSVSSTGSSTDESTSMKGIKASNSMLINGGTFKIDSADDAIHSNASLTVNGGTFDIATGDDGIHADETLTIKGGKINITESYEGIEGLDIKISGGDITLVASDDGLNAAGGTDSSGTGGRDNGMFGGHMGMGGAANGSIVISGGTIDMQASGDGIDSNGTLEITGGMVSVCGPTSGDTAVLDYETTGVITGGTFIGTGSYMMAQTFSSSEQGVIALSVGNQSAGTKITVADEDGNVILTHTPELSFAIVIYSSPDIISGETYKITVGSQSGEFKAS